VTVVWVSGLRDRQKYWKLLLTIRKKGIGKKTLTLTLTEINKDLKKNT